jgi:hypothetical protein
MKIIQIASRHINANNSELLALTDTGEVYCGYWETDWGQMHDAFKWYARLPQIPPGLPALQPVQPKKEKK